MTARQRFLDLVRQEPGARPVVSPFLPSGEVIKSTLQHLGLPAGVDPVENEVTLAHGLDYEPMFMTDCTGLIFPWQVDEARSDADYEVAAIPTARGEWVRRVSRRLGQWGDESGFPLRTEEDHETFVLICQQVGERAEVIRSYFRAWRQRVGEDGVIVIGHPHPTWMAFQISQPNIYYHWVDLHETFCRSMDALFEAALFVMQIALEEGIDFMSDCAYGTEMTSPELYAQMDLPYIRRYADWTHDRGGLFWYHSCGHTRPLILGGMFDRLGADVIETIAPPPEGDNDLAESRRHLHRSICSKGNLDLGLLRDGSLGQVEETTRRMVQAAEGYAHIHSTADAVLPGTPPGNLIAFVQTARRAAGAG